MVSSTLELDWPEDWQRAAERGECLHCGNPLGRFWSPEDGPFCCRGCHGVYEMIHQEHLDRFYDLKPDSHSPAAALRPGNFDWLDALLAGVVDRPGPVRLDLDIQGVHCAACVWLIEELFKREDAGTQLRINSALGKVEVAWDTSRGDLKDFLAEVEKFGYRLGPPRKDGPRQSRALLMRMAVAIAMALNVMMFSLSYYFGLDAGDGSLYYFFGWLSLALATVSLIAGGGVFFKGALAGLRRRVLHLDVPISLGMILAYAGSVWGFLHGGPEQAYFDSLTVFIALMLVGRWAQEHILERNRNSLLDASGAENLTVKRLMDGEPDPLPATEVRQDDELWIAPGDLLPVAAILMRRQAEVSLDWITGESDRVTFVPGDTVPAGAFNLSDHGFAATSAEDFADSRLQDLLTTTSITDEEFRPRWWHRIAGWYVSAVLGAAVIGFAAWFGTGPTQALKVTISILVVTCPCALGLATPLAEELVHGALRRSGVFLRKSGFLEKALAVRSILLDKTGTLTMGDLVPDAASRSALSDLDGRARAVLHQMTARSNHPTSRCLARALRDLPADDDDERIAGPAGEDLTETPGAGLALALPDGLWRLGRPDFAADGPALPGRTLFTRDGAVLADLALSEEFKLDAADEVAFLHDQGYEIHLLSGDAQAKVDAAAAELGVPAELARGGLTPEAKAARVRALDHRDTLMVGDGLNDSPSFEAALCAATPAVDRPVLPGKADFFFLGDGIAAIRRSLQAAHHLRRVVRDNLAIAILYNVAAVGLCLAGLVTPVVAAIIMPVSSVTVVSFTALRLSGRRLAWTSSSPSSSSA
ncbi:MAG: HAD family hydrolase [bacterium]|nr:HAD family hydrolase [bacterium]